MLGRLVVLALSAARSVATAPTARPPRQQAETPPDSDNTAAVPRENACATALLLPTLLFSGPTFSRVYGWSNEQSPLLGTRQLGVSDQQCALACVKHGDSCVGYQFRIRGGYCELLGSTTLAPRSNANWNFRSRTVNCDVNTPEPTSLPTVDPTIQVCPSQASEHFGPPSNARGWSGSDQSNVLVERSSTGSAAACGVQCLQYGLDCVAFQYRPEHGFCELLSTASTDKSYENAHWRLYDRVEFCVWTQTAEHQPSTGPASSNSIGGSGWTVSGTLSTSTDSYEVTATATGTTLGSSTTASLAMATTMSAKSIPETTARSGSTSRPTAHTGIIVSPSIENSSTATNTSTVAAGVSTVSLALVPASQNNGTITSISSTGATSTGITNNTASTVGGTSNGSIASGATRATNPASETSRTRTATNPPSTISSGTDSSASTTASATSRTSTATEPPSKISSGTDSSATTTASATSRTSTSSTSSAISSSTSFAVQHLSTPVTGASTTPSHPTANGPASIDEDLHGATASEVPTSATSSTILWSDRVIETSQPTPLSILSTTFPTSSLTSSSISSSTADITPQHLVKCTPQHVAAFTREIGGKADRTSSTTVLGTRMLGMTEAMCAQACVDQGPLCLAYQLRRSAGICELLDSTPTSVTSLTNWIHRARLELCDPNISNVGAASTSIGTSDSQSSTTTDMTTTISATALCGGRLPLEQFETPRHAKGYKTQLEYHQVLLRPRSTEVTYAGCAARCIDHGLDCLAFQFRSSAGQCELLSSNSSTALYPNKNRNWMHFDRSFACTLPNSQSTTETATTSGATISQTLETQQATSPSTGSDDVTHDPGQPRDTESPTTAPSLAPSRTEAAPATGWSVLQVSFQLELDCDTVNLLSVRRATSAVLRSEGVATETVLDIRAFCGSIRVVVYMRDEQSALLVTRVVGRPSFALMVGIAVLDEVDKAAVGGATSTTSTTSTATATAALPDDPLRNATATTETPATVLTGAWGGTDEDNIKMDGYQIAALCFVGILFVLIVGFASWPYLRRERERQMLEKAHDVFSPGTTEQPDVQWEPQQRQRQQAPPELESTVHAVQFPRLNDVDYNSPDPTYDITSPGRRSGSGNNSDDGEPEDPDYELAVQHANNRAIGHNAFYAPPPSVATGMDGASAYSGEGQFGPQSSRRAQYEKINQIDLQEVVDAIYKTSQDLIVGHGESGHEAAASFNSIMDGDMNFDDVLGGGSPEAGTAAHLQHPSSPGGALSPPQLERLAGQRHHGTKAEVSRGALGDGIGIEDGDTGAAATYESWDVQNKLQTLLDQRMNSHITEMSAPPSGEAATRRRKSLTGSASFSATTSALMHRTTSDDHTDGIASNPRELAWDPSDI